MSVLELKIAYPLRHPSDDTWQRLHRLASSAEPEVRREFLDAIARIRGGIDSQTVQAALARGDVEAVIRLVPLHDLDDALTEAEANLETVRSGAFLLGRDSAVHALDATQLAIHLGERATLRLTWQHVSPQVLDAIRTATADRVTAITDLTRQSLRDLVERSYASGKAPRVIEKEIRDLVGLTPKQTVAVANYRAALEEAGTPPARVERMVERFAAKKLKQRATLIARTETMQATNDGQRASWKVLTSRGLLDGDAWEREWMAIVPSDGRTCPICESLDGARAPIDGDYQEPDAKGGPPIHPDDRCVEKLVAKAKRPT